MRFGSSVSFPGAMKWSVKSRLHSHGWYTVLLLLSGLNQLIQFAMPLNQSANHEAAILLRVIQPGQHDLPLAAARVPLKFDFSPYDRQRMHELAEKNQSGILSSTEQDELESYLRIGRLLDLLAAKARRSLKKRGHNV